MKLEPCKICDGELKIKTENIRHDNGEISHAPRLECQSCGAEFPYVPIEDKAEQIEQAIRVLSNWKNSPDIMKCVGYSLAPQVIETAIDCLKEKQEHIGKAWIMYENKGVSCSNCLEHLCDGWSFCPECGHEMAEK